MPLMRPVALLSDAQGGSPAAVNRRASPSASLAAGWKEYETPICAVEGAVPEIVGAWFDAAASSSSESSPHAVRHARLINISVARTPAGALGKRMQALVFLPSSSGYTDSGSPSGAAWIEPSAISSTELRTANWPAGAARS